MMMMLLLLERERVYEEKKIYRRINIDEGIRRADVSR